jgi:hypothetical protein
VTRRFVFAGVRLQSFTTLSVHVGLRVGVESVMSTLTQRTSEITMKVLLLSCFAATAFLAAAPAANAQVHGAIVVRQAPPAPRFEETPPPRRGYQWVPGYWAWQGRHHVWHEGTWVRARPGYAYRHPEWSQRNGSWQYRPGQWERGDVDHDGVPNALDPDQSPIQH